MATKVTFKRDYDEKIDQIPKVNGQLTYNLDTGETFVDVGYGVDDRIPISPGIGLGISGAAPQQVIIVKKVDENGRPLEWDTMQLSVQGTTDQTLGIGGAKEGQYIIIKTVDADGKPIAWEAVEPKDDKSIDLNIKNAQPDQFVQVAAVDENNIPTAYRTVTVPWARSHRF